CFLALVASPWSSHVCSIDVGPSYPGAALAPRLRPRRAWPLADRTVRRQAAEAGPEEARAVEAAQQGAAGEGPARPRESERGLPGPAARAGHGRDGPPGRAPADRPVAPSRQGAGRTGQRRPGRGRSGRPRPLPGPARAGPQAPPTDRVG